MATKIKEPKKSVRGRPRNADNRQVIKCLLDSAEKLLRDASHLALSERKIAAEAKIDVSMIHYYFGGKDGLIFDLILRYYDDINAQLNALDHIDLASKGVIRQIFKILFEAYYHKPWLMRIVLSEFAKGDSPILSLYKKKFGPRGVGLTKLGKMLELLIERRVCTGRVDPKNVALGLCAMITAPYLLAPVSGKDHVDLSQSAKEKWIDYVVDLFESQLRVME